MPREVCPPSPGPWPRQKFPTQSMASNKAAGGWFSPANQRKRNRGTDKRQKGGGGAGKGGRDSIAKANVV